MSKKALKVVAGTDVPAQDETASELAEGDEFTEKLPPLQIDPTSFDARIAGIELCSVIRELSKHHASVAAYTVEQRQGTEKLSYEEEAKAHREAWEAQWAKRPDDVDEYIEYVKRKAVRFINWDDIGQLWNNAPHDAVELWRQLRLEARAEFYSGHYGAQAFESMAYMHDAWRRAQYLAVRDALIEEWRPRGAMEFILIDQMTQSYVMQIEWTEKAMTRMQTRPRLESDEFYMHKQRCGYTGPQWDQGRWDIPYVKEAAAVEQAFRMVELCQKAFQRAARQLANIRLVRAKTARAKRRNRALSLKTVKVA